MTTMVIPVQAPAKAVTHTALNALPPLKIAVHIDTEVLNPEVARRKANVWLLLYVGHLLRADNPELLWEKGELRWRYDLLLTQPSYGVVGKVANLCVHAITGEVMADASIRREWNSIARKLLQEKGLPVLSDDDYADAEDEAVVIHAPEITHR